MPEPRQPSRLPATPFSSGAAVSFDKSPVRPLSWPIATRSTPACAVVANMSDDAIAVRANSLERDTMFFLEWNGSCRARLALSLVPACLARLDAYYGKGRPPAPIVVIL